MTNPMATQACNDWTKGLDSSGPSIVFMRPLSETSKDPVPRVKMPNTKITITFNYEQSHLQKKKKICFTYETLKVENSE